MLRVSRGGDFRDKLPESEARVFWRQIVQAVQYMHSQGIVHRDLKVLRLLRTVVFCDHLSIETHTRHRVSQLENIMLDRDRNVVIIGTLSTNTSTL
jgi:serine/threonine protein kinase